MYINNVIFELKYRNTKLPNAWKYKLSKVSTITLY